MDDGLRMRDLIGLAELLPVTVAPEPERGKGRWVLGGALLAAGVLGGLWAYGKVHERLYARQGGGVTISDHRPGWHRDMWVSEAALNGDETQVEPYPGYHDEPEGQRIQPTWNPESRDLSLLPLSMSDLDRDIAEVRVDGEAIYVPMGEWAAISGSRIDGVDTLTVNGRVVASKPSDYDQPFSLRVFDIRMMPPHKNVDGNPGPIEPEEQCSICNRPRAVCIAEHEAKNEENHD